MAWLKKAIFSVIEDILQVNVVTKWADEQSKLLFSVNISDNQCKINFFADQTWHLLDTKQSMRPLQC